MECLYSKYNGIVENSELLKYDELRFHSKDGESLSSSDITAYGPGVVVTYNDDYVSIMGKYALDYLIVRSRIDFDISTVHYSSLARLINIDTECDMNKLNLLPSTVTDFRTNNHTLPSLNLLNHVTSLTNLLAHVINGGIIEDFIKSQINLGRDNADISLSSSENKTQYNGERLAVTKIIWSRNGETSQYSVSLTQRTTGNIFTGSYDKSTDVWTYS